MWFGALGFQGFAWCCASGLQVCRISGLRLRFCLGVSASNRIASHTQTHTHTHTHTHTQRFWGVRGLSDTSVVDAPKPDQDQHISKTTTQSFRAVSERLCRVGPSCTWFYRSLHTIALRLHRECCGAALLAFRPQTCARSPEAIGPEVESKKQCRPQSKITHLLCL